MPSQATYLFVPCQQCGASFRTFPSTIRRGGGKYCSLACTTAAHRVPLEERFWANVQKSDACWLWTGRVNDNGYGLVDASGHSRNGGRPLLASRVSYELHHGLIPAGLFVCHTCDTPPCVRPDHLWLGTNTENMQDMKAKGRSSHGTRVRNAKLDDATVQRIIQRWHQGGVMQKQLAEEYGVSRSVISQILSGKLWHHVSVT